MFFKTDITPEFSIEEIAPLLFGHIKDKIGLKDCFSLLPGNIFQLGKQP